MDVLVPELELQQQLQRFATRFLDRIAQASTTLKDSPHPEIIEEALRKYLLYSSSAIEIATGPAAAVNLLDMFVFIRLCRGALDSYWIPTLYGEQGAELGDAFAKSDIDITEIAERALGPAQRAQLANLVTSWQADNPGMTRVEGIRLADFSATAGSAAADRALQARSLLSGVKVATEAANQAMLMAERAMFLVHRLPFLWRLQVRLGAREVLGDTLARVTKGPGALTMARIAKRSLAAAAVLGVAGVVWARRTRHRW
jgi:hypothetical protein